MSKRTARFSPFRPLTGAAEGDSGVPNDCEPCPSSVSDGTIAALLERAVSKRGWQDARIASLDWEDMDSGYSGARLRRALVTFRSPRHSGAWQARFVVKQIEAAGGWLGWATEDYRVREVQLWRAGLLEHLPRGIESAVLAGEQHVSLDGTLSGGTLVLRDMRPYLLRHPYSAPPNASPLLAFLLDRLARLHAAFWQDPCVLDPRLGLMPTAAALSFTAPATIARRLAMGDADQTLREMAVSWEAFFTHISPRAEATLRAVARDYAPIEQMLASLPATLVHGDTWGPNFAIRYERRGRGPRTLVLLDWGLASAAPCTYDPLWLCATWPGLPTPRALGWYRARLALHLSSRGVRLESPTWLALLDAGYLRTVLAGGEAFGRALLDARTPQARTRALGIARWWAERATSAVERLNAGSGVVYSSLQDGRAGRRGRPAVAPNS